MVEKVGLQTTGDFGFTSTDSNTPLTNDFGFSEPLDNTGMQGLTAFDAAYSDSIAELDAVEKGFDAPVGPQVLYSPSTQKMFVNGSTFNVDDYQSAVESERFLDMPPARPPKDIADWQTVSPESFTKYIQKTVNPNRGTLIGRNLEIGGSNLKMLAGRAAQFYGAEETGQELVSKALEELRDNQPFQREFTEIEFGSETGNGAIDWFVANFAQQGPNLLETVVVAGLGYVSGGGALNPLSGVGNAVLSVMGKEGYKKGLRIAAEKYAKGEALTRGEKKLLREATGITAAVVARNPKGLYGNTAGEILNRKQFLKSQVGKQKLTAKTIGEKARLRDKLAGATGAVTLSAQTMGIGDIYGETIEQGDPSRLKAFAGSLPYAAAELLPEFILAKKIFGVNPKKIKSTIDKQGNPLLAPEKNVLVGATDTAGRVGSGFLVGGTLEGATELGQESILLGLTGQMGDAETTKRLINSFAAGFAIGGPIGGAANIIKNKEPTDILGSSDPQPTTTKDKIPEDPSKSNPLNFSGRGGQPITPEPIARSRDLRRQSIVSTPAPQVAAAIPAGQQFLMDQGQQINDKKADVKQQDFFQEQALKRQETLKTKNDTRKRNAKAREDKLAEDLNIKKATTEDLEKRLSKENKLQDQDKENIDSLDDTVEKPIIHKSRGKRIKEGRGEGASAIVTGEIVTVNNKEALITGYISTADKSNLENPSQLGLDNLARYSYEYLDGTGTGLSTESNVVNDNKELLTKPLNAKALKEAKARIKKRENRIKKEDAAKRKEEIERDAATLKAQKKAEQDTPNILDDTSVQPNEDPTNPLALRQQRIKEAKMAAKDVNDGRYKLKGNRIVGIMSVEELVAQRNRLVAKSKKDKRDNRDLEAVNNAISAAEKRARDAAVPGAAVAGAVVATAAAERPTTTSTGTVETASRGIVGGRVLYELSESFNSVDVQAEIDNAELTESFTPMPSGGVNFVQLQGTKEQHERFVQDAGGLIVSFGDDAVEAMSDFTIRTMPKKGGAQDANQEQSPAEVAAREPTTDSGGVAERNQQEPKAQATAESQEDQGQVEDGGTTTSSNQAIEIDNQASKEQILEPANRSEQNNVVAYNKIKNDSFGYGPTFEELPSELQQDVLGFSEVNPQNVEDTFALYNEYIENNNLYADQFTNYVNVFEEAETSSEKIPAIQGLIRLAYGAQGTETSGAVYKRAIDYLDNALDQTNIKDVTDIDRTNIRNVFTEFINLNVKKSASTSRTTDGVSMNVPNPWYKFAISNNLMEVDPMTGILDQKDITLEITRLPTNVRIKQPEVSGDIIKNKASKKEDVAPESLSYNQALEELDTFIDDSIQRLQLINSKTNSKKTQRVEKLWAAVRETNPDVVTRVNEGGKSRGIPIKNYFTNGKLNLKQDGKGSFVVTTETDAQRREKQRLIQEARNKKEEGRYKNYDSINGDFFDNDGKPITSTVPQGKIKLMVSSFISRLKVKPNVTVVKNTEDLRIKNPKLYNRAVAGRPNGDFGQLNAVGYSIGDQVIIFSDFAKTEQQVRFALAHETLGHFGFRAFMPEKQLNKILKEIYDTDGYVRAATDRRIERRESKFEAVEEKELLEAVEEVIADSAASLDANIILKLWNAVKNFLNKLGMTFEDDLARYLVNQSRRNLFRGGYGVVSMETLTSNMRRLASESTYGRYHIETNRADLGSRLVGFLSSTKNQGANNVVSIYDYLVRAKDNITGGAFADRLGKALQEVQTFDNLSDKNEGAQLIFNLFQRATATTRELQQKYEKLTEFTLSSGLDRPPSKYDSNATQEEVEQAGELLAYANAYIAQQTSELDIQNAPSLIVLENNMFRINPEAVAELKQRGILSKEQFQEGFDITLPVTEGTDTTENYRMEEISDRVYDIYLEQREAINTAAIDLLSANLQNIENEKDSIAHTFAELVGNEGFNTETENKTLKNIINKYIELYQEDFTQEGSAITYNDTSRKRAEEFLREVNRAMHTEEKLNDWIAGEAGIEFKNEFAGDEFADIIEGLKKLNVIFNDKDKLAYKITESIKGLYILDNKNVGAEYRAKQTLMDGYVPFKRSGSHEVLVTAVDQEGNPISLPAIYKDSLPYYQVEGRIDAENMVEEVNKVFGDTEFVISNNKLDKDEDITVRFKASYGDVRSNSPAAVDGNLSEFLGNLQRFNVPLGVEKREEIIKAFTAQNDRMRKSLKKSFQPGFDTTKIIQNIAEHLETQSHAAAKAYYRFKLTKIMQDSDLFRGNINKLKKLEKRMLDQEARAKAGNINEETLLESQREYDAYAHMFYYSAPVGENTVNLYSGRGTNRTKQTSKTLGRYNVYQAKAQELVAFYDGAKNIDVSTEDLLSGAPGSLLKTATVAFQLGGSVATGLINLVSLITHTIPYLSTYNSRNGYGGGFGMMQSSGYVFDAIKDMSDLGGSISRERSTGLAKYAFVEKVKNDKKLQAKYNLKQDEADVLFDATRQGVLQAAQFNALVGTARGGVSRFRVGTSLMRTWMSVFSYTEQLNRRATFLAAYRMQKNRLMAGRTDKVSNEIKNEAEAFAIKAVNKSQGEYGMFNRPEMARGNILQYIFMYKQFVIITVQLMRNLGRKEQAAMMLLLLFAGGLKGLPFGEDLLDLYDTLAQMFGFKVGPADKDIAKAAEKVFPGFGQYALRGFLDSATGATISTRLGFGDIIPATGAFKAGADPWREASNFLGPVWSAVTQATGFATDSVKITAESLGLKDDSGMTMGSLLRSAPLGGVRGITEAVIYGMDGTITNRSGKLIKNDVSGLEIFFRALNFHPAEATRQNEIIRMNKQTADYAKTFKQNYINRYVKAKTNKDFREVAKIMRGVNEFNNDYRGTPFEIRNFAPSAERAYKSSTLPVAARYKKFAPRNIRPEVQEMLDMYGYTAADLK